MRLTAALFFLPLCAMMATVRAGETETQCESPHQVASVAQAVTDACQDATGSDGLPEHCTAECAAVFLPWFDDGQSTCFRALHLDEQTEQIFSAFASVCETENSGVDMTGAIFVHRPSDSQNSTLICFDATCGAAPILNQRGAIVVEGCEAGASLGAVCRLGCSASFEISAVEDGHCSLSEVGSLAVYTGHSVTCSPETEQNGQMSESYCRMAATEAMLDCCELEGVEGVVCAADVPPTTCVVECAEIWEPLVEDCEQHLQDFQQFTAECAEVADSFLAQAPSSLTVTGLQCIADANGEYQLSDTVGGKPHWVLNDSFGHTLYHLYAVDEPFEAWVIGISLRSNSANIESYEDEPPWGPHMWRENCGGAGGMTDQLLTVTPSFSDHDCHEAIQLMSAELSDFCFDPSDQSADFEVTMAAEQAPTSCEYDCAHLWYPYSEECADFLQRRHPYLASFTELCFATHRGMEVISADGHLDAGGHDDHTFRARQGLVYSIEEVPGDGLQRSDLAIEAPHSHHVLADRIDVSKQGAGVHRIEWDAPQTKSGMDIAVTALEGSGSYHLQAEIIGTAERLAKEAIIGRESLLQIEQHWFDVAEFRYEGMHMRADGTSFLLKFSAGAGLTYQVLAVLRAGSAAAHLRLAIFPPEAIGSASSTGAASESNCQLPPAAHDLQSKDVTEMTFGTWGSPAHGQTWGEQHRCPDLTRVGPPESQPAGCGGQYRYFPGQSFPSNHTWDWTAPFTANYVLQVTANCDVPFYDDPTQPSCTVSADGIECDDGRVTQCAAAIGLTIRVVDRSVHVKHTFDVPTTQEVLNSIELQQRMADMFALQQQPAIVFPLSITPLDCGLAENAERPSCQQVVDPGPGGGHRRRRLQTQIGADTDHACPQSSFDTRDRAMRTSCGFQVSDAADPLLQGSCPSLECARQLLPLLDDCAEHIAEFARHIGPEAAFYEALRRSEMFADCEEMEQAAAQFASVQVEFRAPTLNVANQMIIEHQQMVSDMFLPTSQRDGGRQLCFGNPDPSVADGTPCGGRRQLDREEIGVDVCAAKDEKIRRLQAELEKSRAETQTAIQQSIEKDMVIEQQSKAIEKQVDEIAFHRRLHRLKQNAVTTRNSSTGDSAKWSRTASRRIQAIGDSSTLRPARVGVDRSVKACAVHPCALGDDICQNGGMCTEVVPEVGGAMSFECQCVGGFGGGRCEMDSCKGVTCDSPFVASGIVTEAQAAFLASQPEIAGGEWIPCFDSATNDASDASIFHAQCNQHEVTVSIASNALGYTFGGYGDESWEPENAAGSTTKGTSACFIFRLGPGEAQRFDPTGVDTNYMDANPDFWPSWGTYDLHMGMDGPPGHYGRCNQGRTYSGSPDQTCGGGSGDCSSAGSNYADCLRSTYNWGETRLVVYYRAPPPPPLGQVVGLGSREFGALGTRNMTEMMGTDNAQIVTSSQVSLVVKQDGRVFAFGRDIVNVDGSWQETYSTPTEIAGFGQPVQICMGSGGSPHVLALQANGSVLGYGQNSYGSLGLGESFPGFTPGPYRTIVGLKITQPTQINTLGEDNAYVATSWFHSAVVKTDGRVFTFGHNAVGELGDGTFIDRLSPTEIPTLGNDNMKVEVGMWFSLVLKSDGSVGSFGRSKGIGDGCERSGQQDSSCDKPVPYSIPEISGAVQIAAGAGVGYALTDDGRIFAWGSNRYGQLGDGSMMDQLRPVEVTLLGGDNAYIPTNLGDNGYMLVLKEDGRVFGFGGNRDGQLGVDESHETTLIDYVQPLSLHTVVLLPTEITALGKNNVQVSVGSPGGAGGHSLVLRHSVAHSCPLLEVNWERSAGRIIYSDAMRSHESTATVICDAGHVPRHRSGTAVWHCQENGRWDGPATDIDCLQRCSASCDCYDSMSIATASTTGYLVSDCGNPDCRGEGSDGRGSEGPVCCNIMRPGPGPQSNGASTQCYEHPQEVLGYTFVGVGGCVTEIPYTNSNGDATSSVNRRERSAYSAWGGISDCASDCSGVPGCGWFAFSSTLYGGMCLLYGPGMDGEGHGGEATATDNVEWTGYTFPAEIVGASNGTEELGCYARRLEPMGYNGQNADALEQRTHNAATVFQVVGSGSNNFNGFWRERTEDGLNAGKKQYIRTDGSPFFVWWNDVISSGTWYMTGAEANAADTSSWAFSVLSSTDVPPATGWVANPEYAGGSLCPRYDPECSTDPPAPVLLWEPTCIPTVGGLGGAGRPAIVVDARRDYQMTTDRLIDSVPAVTGKIVVCMDTDAHKSFGDRSSSDSQSTSSTIRVYNDHALSILCTSSSGLCAVHDRIEFSAHYQGARDRIYNNLIDGFDAHLRKILFADLYTLRDGGAVYVAGSTASVHSCKFVRNQANNGGAIFADNGAQLTVASSLFVENAAQEYGAAIFVRDMYVRRPTKLILLDSTFTGNSGALEPAGGTIRMTGGATFVANLFDRRISAFDPLLCCSVWCPSHHAIFGDAVYGNGGCCDSGSLQAGHCVGGANSHVSSCDGSC